jgi:hypothetical protein
MKDLTLTNTIAKIWKTLESATDTNAFTEEYNKEDDLMFYYDRIISDLDSLFNIVKERGL